MNDRLLLTVEGSRGCLDALLLIVDLGGAEITRIDNPYEGASDSRRSVQVAPLLWIDLSALQVGSDAWMLIRNPYTTHTRAARTGLILDIAPLPACDTAARP